MIAVLGGILLVVVIAEVVRYLRKRGGAKENEKGKTGKEEVKKKEAPMAKEWTFININKYIVKY